MAVSGARVFQISACSYEEMFSRGNYPTTAFELVEPHRTLSPGAFLYTNTCFRTDHFSCSKTPSKYPTPRNTVQRY